MINTALQILVVEDNPGDYLLVEEYLSESFKKASIFHAVTLANALKILDEIQIDVVLLDLTLPDTFGISSFNTINAKKPNIPVIILTGLEDTATALESLKIGVQDYIVKDHCDSIVLNKSITYSIERSKIRQSLKRSEEQYRFLFYDNPLPMFAHNVKSNKIIMANKAAVVKYGYTEEELLAMSFDDLSVKKGAEQSLSQNATDILHYKKNGEVLEVEVGAHVTTIEGQTACLSAIHDVTERNRSKERLRESEEMFRTISENLPNGAVAILDKNFTILYIAGKDLPKSGLPASSLQNRSLISLTPLPEREKVTANLQKVIDGETTVFEVKFEDLSYMISAVPLNDPSGNINKILLASQNITEQKKNESEKEMLIEELTRNNNDLKQFSYITSHNLRAPLSNLLGIIKLLDTSTVTDPTTTLLLKNFEECTFQLNDTVNDLINVLIIKNSVNAKKEKLDIRTIFERVKMSVSHNIAQNHVAVHTDFDNAYEVDFNRTYLESILLNLLTNAIKYSSPKRQPEICIKTKKVASGVVLYFSDNGLGIDLKRHKDRIFGLYQRFHDHADSKGLGLYMVNSQIRVMGGEIDVESEVDKGTTFIIRFKN